MPKTPTTQTALGSDPEGPPVKEAWKYSSVVGMLLYLSTNTRPDIAFAVSQVAQFNSNPNQSHASAVKMIIRYLSATSDKGIIFTPTTAFKVDCYVDADFAGLHGREPQDLSASTCSHTGYIMFFCACPLIWKSQLQTESTQPFPCRIYCPLISHQKTHHHPMSSPRTCTLPTHDLHNSCHPC